MHLAYQSEGVGIEPAPCSSPSRRNKFVVASAAVLAAGAVAVSPMAPSMTEIQQRAFQLTADGSQILDNPLTLWQDTFSEAFANVNALAATMAEQPFPVVTQVAANQQAYLDLVIGQTAAEVGGRRGTGLVGAAEGVQNTIALFETRLEAAQGYLASGDITAAWGEIESALLIGLENVGMPLLSPLAIPGDMIQNLADVYDSLVTRGTSVAITRGLLAPPITASFALANVAEVAVKKLQIGDYEGALTAVVNGPAIVTGAFLNGYKPALTYDDEGNPLTYATESFQGVLTPRHPNPTDPAGTPNGQGGTIDQFFVTLPRAIATALKPPVAAATVVAGSQPGEASSAKLVTVDEVAADDTTTSTTDEVKEISGDTATTTGSTTTKKSSFAEKAAERAEARAKKAKDTRDHLNAAVKSVSDNIKKAVSGGKTGDKESTTSSTESTDSDSGSDSE